MGRLPRLRVVGGQGSGKNALSESYEGSRGRGARGSRQAPNQKRFLRAAGGFTRTVILLAGAVLLGSAPRRGALSFDIAERLRHVHRVTNFGEGERLQRLVVRSGSNAAPGLLFGQCLIPCLGLPSGVI